MTLGNVDASTNIRSVVNNGLSVSMIHAIDNESVKNQFDSKMFLGILFTSQRGMPLVLNFDFVK